MVKKKALKSLLKNRKAVSPAISGVIMSAAVITVGLIVLSWANNNFMYRQQESSEFFSNQSDLISENFVIEDVWFYTGGVNVTLRNVGKIDITITEVTFNGTNRLGIPVSVAVAQAATVTLDWNWGAGQQLYTVQVNSERDQSITETYSTTG